MKCLHCSSSDTVWKSKAGKWECGSCEERFDAKVPADLFPVSAAASLVSIKALKPKRIFFSYGHDANRDLVDRFKTDLEGRGHQVWIDYKEIGTWDDWKGTITRGIHDAELAIAFLSIHSTRDPGVCRNEVAMALQHFGKVYPVLMEEVPRESIPVTIAHLQWPDLSRWRQFRDQDDLDFERFYEEKFLEIVSRVEGEAGRFASEAEVLRRALNPSGFEGRFARHLDGFTGREWVFDAFEHWLDRQPSSRVFWIKAGPGFGKTALAVQMANRHRAAIVGTWFCDHQSVELRDPLRALQTIAYQLALRWDDYRVRLLPRLGLYADSSPEQIGEARKELAKKNSQDLFSFLISEPMAGLIWREHKLVILVDALDEAAEADETNPLAALISGRFLELPEWIGFVVTSRPDASVLAHLQGFKPFAIEAGDSRNTADLQSYAKDQIGPLLDGVDVAERERLCALLAKKSAGMMLYLRLVAEGLREGTLAVEDLGSLKAGLPGLHGRYHAGFEARFGKYFHDTVQPLLRLIMAAPGPMPLDLAAEVLEWDRELTVRTRARVGSYLVEDQGGLSLFHKTLGGWLGSESAALYFTDAESAANKLGTFLWECFDNREKDENDLTKPLRWEHFVSDWLPDLLEHTERRNDWDGIWKFVSWFGEKSQFGHMIALSRTAVEGREKSLGWEHPDTLQSINCLGNFLRIFKGDLAEAELLNRRALEGRERTLGLEHPDTLSSVSDFGDLLLEKRDLAEAEALHRRALKGREQALGPEHPDTLSSVNNLGDLLFEKGDLAEAEALHRRALEGCEKALGPEHPHTLRCVYLLAHLLDIKGDSAGAEALHRRALEGVEKSLGAEHPDTLSSVHDLGILLHKKGDYYGAEALYRKALVGQEKALGAEHPDSLHSVNSLGSLLHKKGDYDGAEDLYRKALVGQEKSLGAEHPDTLRSVHDLGSLLHKKGDYDGAEALYRKALVGQEKALGADHPDSLHTVNNLGILVKNKGDYDSAEALYRRALESREYALGAEHPDTLNSAYGLGIILNYLGRRHEAIKLLRRFASLSEAAQDAMAYNLACYECLEGNIYEAKRLITAHLKKHPDKKDQALADGDFAAIREWIYSLEVQV
jgi:tetratricopeptide (TPR) repeat protein